MKKELSLGTTLCVLPFLTGCVGVGPNTQQGAVVGGAIGALAGAVIGHNSHGGESLGGALLGGTAGAIAGGTLGNSVDNEQGTLYGGSPPMGSTAFVRSVPAPPSFHPDEIHTPPPTPASVWIAGYWIFDRGSYRWMAGHWEVPPPNTRVYMAPHWERRAGGYGYAPGYWR
jgi:hypothetical protein